MRETALIVYCTVPDEASARDIARLLISKKLAACCNIIPGIRSVYYWDEKLEESAEHLLLIKTLARRYEQLEKEIKMIHPYTVPEIIATPLENVSQAYLDWIIENVE